jgi:DNA-binding FadR family transcriptional regulator
MYSSVQPTRLYEKIVDQIQDLFVAGKLRPGDKLPPERELAEMFGVSRTAVRDAVNTLREKGLVQVISGKGTFITDITTNGSELVRDSLSLIVKTDRDTALAHLIQVRAIMEPGIAALAAEMATEEDIQLLRQAVDEMDAILAEAELDVERFVEADLKFHHALAAATRLRLIFVLLRPIVDLFREQLAMMGPIAGAQERGQYHHKRILEAVQQRDPAAAQQAMVAHLQQVRDDINSVEQVAK